MIDTRFDIVFDLNKYDNHACLKPLYFKFSYFESYTISLINICYTCMFFFIYIYIYHLRHTTCKPKGQNTQHTCIQTRLKIYLLTLVHHHVQDLIITWNHVWSILCWTHNSHIKSDTCYTHMKCKPIVLLIYKWKTKLILLS